MADLDQGAIMADHGAPHRCIGGWHKHVRNPETWPCLPYRLAKQNADLQAAAEATAQHHYELGFRAALDVRAMNPDRWWRAVGPDGELWCETSDEDEVRQMVRPGDRIERLYRVELTEWRVVALDGAE